MDKLKKVEQCADKSVEEAIEAFDRLDPRMFGERRKTETFRIKRRGKKYHW